MGIINLIFDSYKKKIIRLLTIHSFKSNITLFHIVTLHKSFFYTLTDLYLITL